MPRLALRQYNYYYRVNGEKAEQLLKDYGVIGDFLVRYSESNPLNFSISVRSGEYKVTHLKVTKFDNDMLSIFENQRTSSNDFDSITGLLEHYIENSDKLRDNCGHMLILQKPVFVPYALEKCAEEQRITQLYRWWHGNLPAASANRLLSEKPNGTYLVRASQHIPGALVISAKTENTVVHLTIYQDIHSGKYNIDGDRTKFNQVWLLIDSYSKNPIVEKGESSRVVYLKTPLFNTFIQSDLFIDRYDNLRKPLDPRESMEKTGIAEEYMVLCDEAVPDERLYSKKTGKKEKNVPRNRYKNIVPFDHMRVILKDTNPEDYINASYVKIENSLLRTKNVTFACPQTYIATQGPLPDTIVDFWRMIWQENCRVIVMLTQETEGKDSKEKCAKYWPEEQDVQHAVYGLISIQCTEQRLVHREVSPEVRAELEVEKQNRLAKGLIPEPELDGNGVSYIFRTFSIRKANEKREIRQLQYTTWPDHGCPIHPYAVLNLLEDVDKEHEYFNKKLANQPTPQGPIVVHCSAGIGRTGTILVIKSLLSQVKHAGLVAPLDVYKMVKYMRKYRSGMVQTEQQYQFIYKAIAFWLKHNNPHPQKSLTIEDAEAAFDTPRRLRAMAGSSRTASASRSALSRPSSSASSVRAAGPSTSGTASYPRPILRASPEEDRDTPSTSASLSRLRSSKR